MTRAAFLTLLVGCHSTLQVHLVREDTEDRDLVVEAADLLGVDVGFADDDRGSVRLMVANLCDPRLAGAARVDQWGCYRDVDLANRDPISIAHEVGHALGLEHTGEPGNLMFSCGSPGDEVTEAQQDAVIDEVTWLGTWCR